LSTVEKMMALRSAPIFSSLPPEGLAELARSSVEAEYAARQALCVEGEPGNEVFILLAGEVDVLIGEGANAKVVAQEKAGGFIGEMAVLDPAPRSATVIAGADGVRVLRLGGDAFRGALNTDPAIASGVIRTLAQRLRTKAK
ncbi:MAG TPA: cyclic nucleotide-binding domain-containing protein, partial [Pyrinomonadaceae bacterium]|nr:cyclic nucleotide-binding domain-containing protein [Pyrinomonadaceae bacterium]